MNTIRLSTDVGELTFEMPKKHYEGQLLDGIKCVNCSSGILDGHVEVNNNTKYECHLYCSECNWRSK